MTEKAGDVTSSENRSKPRQVLVGFLSRVLFLLSEDRVNKDRGRDGDLLSAGSVSALIRCKGWRRC